MIGCMKTRKQTLVWMLLALLPSCVTTHKPVLDYGREGEGVLLKCETTGVVNAGVVDITVPATVYLAGGKRYVAACPARFVRRGRTCIEGFYECNSIRYEAKADETRMLYGEVAVDPRTGCLVRTQTPWQESLPAGAVLQGQPVKLHIPAGESRACRDGVVLVTSDLHAGADALWAYPLGAVLAVADVPMTAAFAGGAAVVLGATQLYEVVKPSEYCERQEPREEPRAEN